MINKEEQLVLILPIPPKIVSLGTSVLTTQGFPICKETRPDEISRCQICIAANPREKWRAHTQTTNQDSGVGVQDTVVSKISQMNPVQTTEMHTWYP